jgi:hypothetical protein
VQGRLAPIITIAVAEMPETPLRLGLTHLQSAKFLEHQERGYEAYALRLLGDIAAHRDPPESAPAVAHYRQALTPADALGMRLLQAHCHRALGPLYALTGQREQARTALTTAIEMDRAMDMTFWLPQAEAVLARTG